MDPEPASKVEIIRNMSSEMDCFVFVPTILSATYKQSTFMYILYNQLPLYVCALWKKNKYSFFLSFFQYADQIKTFCFRSDNKWTKSICFASIY